MSLSFPSSLMRKRDDDEKERERERRSPGKRNLRKNLWRDKTCPEVVQVCVRSEVTLATDSDELKAGEPGSCCSSFWFLGREGEGEETRMGTESEWKRMRSNFSPVSEKLESSERHLVSWKGSLRNLVPFAPSFSLLLHQHLSHLIFCSIYFVIHIFIFFHTSYSLTFYIFSYFVFWSLLIFVDN